MKNLNCPLCNESLCVEDNANAIICTACGNGFFMASKAAPGAASQTAGEIGKPTVARRLRRPAPPKNGLYVTAQVFNWLSFGIGAFAALMGVIVYCFSGNPGVREIVYDFVYTGSAFAVPAICLSLICVGKYWSLLPEDLKNGRSPAAAALFMLIPFFNLYWVFVLHRNLNCGLAKEMGLPPRKTGFFMFMIFLGLFGPVFFGIACGGYLSLLEYYQRAAKKIAR